MLGKKLKKEQKERMECLKVKSNEKWMVNQEWNRKVHHIRKDLQKYEIESWREERTGMLC